MAFRVETLPALAALGAEAVETLRPAAAEGAGYHAALAAMGPGGMETHGIVVRDASGAIVLAAPLFSLTYRLDTPLQGRNRRFAEWLQGRWPGLLTFSLLGVGSPYCDDAALMLAPDATDPAGAFGALLAGLEAEAKRRNAGLVAFKDLDPQSADRHAQVLVRAGFASVGSLPVAELRVPETLEAWFASLSKSTRKDIRRKLARSIPRLEIEHRADLGTAAGEVARLYEETRSTSEVGYGDFERLPVDFFEQVAAHAPARFSFYRVGGVLVGFNLLLLGRDRVIDKFIGLRQPQAREHDVYALSWVENLRFCIQTGRQWLQSGQTAYADKMRFGSLLSPRMLYVRHRNPLLHRLIALAAPWLDFARHDPVLGHDKGTS